ncbi:MAG TPA: IucA/IucC family siderophore biosynthesis protein [Actinopolymorphaceae bacterium]
MTTGDSTLDRPGASATEATHIPDPTTVVAHLAPEVWQVANRRLVRKALAEFAHERLISPRRLNDATSTRGSRYVVVSDDGDVVYEFSARVLALEHWQIDEATLVRRRGSDVLPLDAMAFVLEFRRSLQLADDVLPVYLEEIGSTLASQAYKLSRQALSADELVKAEFQTIEHAMTEGHPCFVANSGRLGFDAREYLEYAPEVGQPVRLFWIAAHRGRASFHAVRDVTYDSLIARELGAATLDRFRCMMRHRGLDLDDYLVMPMHPWQWWNRIAVTFAGDIAERQLVCLGPGDDDYQAQQSVRTFFNLSDPSKHYVKTALSVLNMGFLRGLSAGYMRGTPAINDWICDLLRDDEVIARTGFGLLRECASVGYENPHFAAAVSKGSPYLKMLAALWRESPIPLVHADERLATMAALLHVDNEGTPFVAALIADSGLDPETWLRRYLDVYLVPLVHCLCAYDLAFMPHGENVILVLHDSVPQRVFVKDIAEEVALMGPDRPMPPAVERIRLDVPDEIVCLSIFTDVFDCFFRFLSAILDEAGVLSQERFWSCVASCIRDYQTSTPHLAEKFQRYDMFVDRFALSCLNRLQLRNNRQMVDLDNPADALQFVGTLQNPLAGQR